MLYFSQIILAFVAIKLKNCQSFYNCFEFN